MQEVPFLSALGIVGFSNEVPTRIPTDLLCMVVSMGYLLANKSCVHVISQLNREITINY